MGDENVVRLPNYLESFVWVDRGKNIPSLIAGARYPGIGQESYTV
jgi:hypothetical protein